MMADKRLRVNVNSQAIYKVASLVSNSVILSANAFLLGSSIQNQIRDRKRDRRVEGLQLTAEIAGAVAGLTKVVINTVSNNAQPTDL
ncbi:MAG: hypothetical protein ISR95_00290 [Candidatus Marinimicrobia bacterium]|nr:hypothetical protein [Candidatus Neomarinimicrobiota bacterium]MBL7046069.1 hypothetical protein [Candidatus Neomarinimicrobiota bacterium]